MLRNLGFISGLFGATLHLTAVPVALAEVTQIPLLIVSIIFAFHAVFILFSASCQEEKKTRERTKKTKMKGSKMALGDNSSESSEED